jgi:hypothetical protein
MSSLPVGSFFWNNVMSNVYWYLNKLQRMYAPDICDALGVEQVAYIIYTVMPEIYFNVLYFYDILL